MWSKKDIACLFAVSVLLVIAMELFLKAVTGFGLIGG